MSTKGSAEIIPLPVRIKLDIGSEFRSLAVGERTELGDEVWNLNMGPWVQMEAGVVVNAHHPPIRRAADDYKRRCRRLAAIVRTGQTGDELARELADMIREEYT